MAKRTVLDMVQSIMSAMDADVVNSIDDTVESLQVADVLRDTFYILQDDFRLPYTKGLVQLDSSGDPDTPVVMTIPESTSRIETVRYDVSRDPARKRYRAITRLEPDQFLSHIYGRSDESDNVDVMMLGDLELLIRNDTYPEYWTSFDDETLVFDAYNADVESTLQTSKTVCTGMTRPEWTHSDAAVPDLPENLHSLLLAEAKQSCMYLFQQAPSPKMDEEVRRLRRRAEINQHRQGGNVVQTPHYGRR